MTDENTGSTDIRVLPWWQSPGAEFCYFCETPAHAEGLAYCIACDRPICMLCLDDSRGHRFILCPDCRRHRPEGAE